MASAGMFSLSGAWVAHGSPGGAFAARQRLHVFQNQTIIVVCLCKKNCKNAAGTAEAPAQPFHRGA